MGKTSEYDLEMPRSKTTDQPSCLFQDDGKTRNGTKNYITKQGPNTKPMHTMGATTNNDSTTESAP